MVTYWDSQVTRVAGEKSAIITSYHNNVGLEPLPVLFKSVLSTVTIAPGTFEPGSLVFPSTLHCERR